jgi:hypothetical protein
LLKKVAHIRNLGFKFQQGQKIFLFSQMSTPALRTKLPHIQGVPVFFPEGKAADV